MHDVQNHSPAIDVGAPSVTLRGAWKVGLYRVEPMANRVVGKGGAVRLEPRVMDVLTCLMKRAGETITHDDLHELVWTGVVVDESALRRAISQLRKAFGDDAASPEYIETIRKTGYRLIAPVSSLSGGDRLEIVPHARAPRRSRSRGLWGAALLIVVAVAAVTVFQEESDSSPDPLPVRPLTSAPGVELRPRLSPDGSYVAYAADNGGSGLDLFVQVVGVDAPLRLTATAEVETAPAWSPDGRRIAFLRTGPAEAAGCGIYSISVLGGDEQKISACGGTAHGSLAWSPDGRLLAYPLREDVPGPFRMVLLDLETLERRTLTVPPSDLIGDVHPAFSKDGSTIAFVRVVEGRIQDLHTVAVAGGAPRRLTSDAGFVAGHDWAPDGRSIVMSSNRSGRFKLWRVPADGGTPTWLANVGAYDPGSPSVARSGGRMVYEEWNFDFNIWRQKLENGRPAGTPERIAASTRWDLHPQLSPDAGRIVFTSNRAGSQDLWMAPADGGPPQRLTAFPDGYVSAPRWSPDGDQIVFELRSGGAPGIYVLNAEGGSPVLLAEGGGAPSWSRDGASIYYGSNRDGTWMVFKIPVGGGAPTAVIDGAFSAQEGLDGSSIYYTKYAVPGLWRRSLEGDSETLIVETLDPVDAESWVVTYGGVYVVDRSHGADQIRFYDLQSGVSHLVLATAQPIPPGKASLSASPDGSVLLFGQIDERESDIMLVEGLEFAR